MGGDMPAHADLDANYADALLREPAHRLHAKLLIDDLLKRNHPDALSLLARYNAIRSPQELRSEPAAGSERLTWLSGVAPGKTDEPVTSASEPSGNAVGLAEARRAGAEALRRRRLAAEQMEKARLAMLETEKERLRRQTAEEEERKRLDLAAREERLRAQELEKTREENERLLRLAEEEERKRHEERERLERDQAALREENERDIRYIEAVHRHLPRFEPHAAVLMFRLMDANVPAGALLYERHRQLRPGADLERFRKYSPSDIQLARNGIQMLLDEEAQAIARELQAEEAKFRQKQNAMEMLLQDRNNVKKFDAAANTIWVDPRTWQALDQDMRTLLLRGVAAHCMELHKSATPYGSIRSFSDNSLLGEMDGQNKIHIY